MQFEKAGLILYQNLLMPIRRPQSFLHIALVFITFVLLVMGFSIFLPYQTPAGYLVPLILLLLTWMLYKREGRSLSALGLGSRKWKWLPIGLVCGVVFLAAALLLQLFWEGRSVQYNSGVHEGKALAAIFLFLAGVLNEELIFRGYCLQHLVARIGFWKANLLFAWLFMMWHWLSWNAWGNMTVMLFSVTTAFGHFLFATALYRKGTLFFPIGIHLGINWASYALFIMDGKARADGFFTVGGVPGDATFMALGITVSLYLVAILFLWSRKKEVLFDEQKVFVTT